MQSEESDFLPEGRRERKQKVNKTSQIVVRVTDSEKAALFSRAKRSGLTCSAYLRQMGFSGEITLHSQTDKAAYEELRRIGVNLNQIARNLNIGKEVANDEFAFLQDMLFSTLEKLAVR